MVTCKLLGRTCNQMFIIAAVIGYAKKYGLEYHIPGSGKFIHLENKNWNPSLPKIQISERSFAYNHLPAPVSNNCNIELVGYFQSHKYFAHCIEDVKKAFNFPRYSNPGKIAVHIRLGDYKDLPDCHPLVSKEYIKSATEILYKKGVKKLIVLSDEIELARRLYFPGFIHEEKDENTSDLEDLWLGASCDHVIGSNSSFSLWMYYLNENPDKIGIFPRNWFGPKLPHDTRDLYPPNTIIL